MNELKFSASRLGTYENCSRKHHNIYRLGYRKPYTSSAMALGSIVHRLLDLHYTGTCPPNEAYQNYLKEEFPTYEEQIHCFTAITLVNRYIHKWSKIDERYRIVGVERENIVPFTTPNKAQVYLHGIMDLVLLDEQDRVILMDHKTSSRKVWNVDSVWLDPQIGFYMVMLMSMDYDPYEVVINQISTQTHDQKKIMKLNPDELFSRFKVNPTPTVLESWTKEIGDKIDRILEERVHPKSQSNQCQKNCPFFEACLMELRGQDPGPWLHKTYVQLPSLELDFTIEGLED